MKIIHTLILVCILVLVSCKGPEPSSPYVYEPNPHYAWGYAQFFGAYYNWTGNKNNVITVSLFSDSLSTNDQGSLQGFGQFLYLEDVFVATKDTKLPVGIYKIDNSGDINTITPGILDTIDNEVYTLGATISYYEENVSRSTLKLISEGTITVTRGKNNYTLICDLKTSDKKELKGSFTGELPHSDESLTPQIIRSKKKLDLILQ